VNLALAPGGGWRRCFATYLERAQGVTLKVNPSVIAELMGHAKGTLALDVYSGGLRLRELRDAIKALDRVIEKEVLAVL
jgi:integrase